MSDQTSFRVFNSPGGQTTNGVGYCLDQTSGVFRPFYNTDFASTSNISLTGATFSISAVAITGTLPNVAVTGGSLNITGFNTGITVAVSVASLPTQNVAVTGGSILTIVTGSVSTSVNAVAVTGNPGFILTGIGTGVSVQVIDTGNRNVSVVNTAPIPISGVVQATLQAAAIQAVSGFVTPIWTGAPNVTVANQILAISGVVTTSAGNAAITGGSIQVTNQVSTYDTTGNLYLAAISGALTSNLNGAVWVTGGPVAVTGTVQVTETGIRIVSGVGTFTTTVAGTVSTSITNGVVPVSGVIQGGNLIPLYVTGAVISVVTGAVSVSISNPIGVTGVAVDLALPIINGFAPHFLPIGGRVTNATGAGSITGYNSTGDMAMLNINSVNGGLYVNQGVLQSNQDCVTTTQSGNSAISNSAVSGLAQTVLTANPGRIAWGISNFSTGALMLIMGSTNPTTGNVHFVLQGGVNLNDGKGGIFIDSPAVWQGAVTVSGVTPGLSMTYSAWQI